MTSISAERSNRFPVLSFQFVPKGTYFVVDDSLSEDVFLKASKALVVIVYSGIRERIGTEVVYFKDDSPVTPIKKLDIKYSL